MLLVDDEEPIVRMMSLALRQLGYEVVTCTNGLEARDLFRTAPNRYDVVVTDQTMPQLTGIQLAEAVLLLRPDIPVILCTGYSDLVDASTAKANGIREFIVKPFMPHVLAQTIRRTMGQNTPGEN
jgi:DNA-binding NtrC family response regulator